MNSTQQNHVLTLCLEHCQMQHRHIFPKRLICSPWAKFLKYMLEPYTQPDIPVDVSALKSLLQNYSNWGEVMKHNTDSILFRCTISGPSALIICPILCIGMLIAIVICSYYLVVIPLLLLCIPLYPLIGLGLWSTWKESAVLIITDKVVCLMRHGKTITSFPLTELRSAGLYTLQWYDRPFQKLYFSTLPYDSDEER